MSFSGSNDLLRCRVVDNLYEGVKCSNYSATITLCEIARNGDAGVEALNSNITVNNCLIVENEGGGIKGSGGTSSEVYVYNSTIANNVATRYGGGISGTQLRIANCILYGNIGPGAGQVYVTDNNGINSAWASIADCLLQGGPAAVYRGKKVSVNFEGRIIDNDPGFASAHDYHLCPGSCCIDGDGWAHQPQYDLDGNARREGGVYDWGAYEYCAYKPTIAVSCGALIYSVPVGGESPQERSVVLRNCGGTVLNWEAVEDCGWLTATPTSGTLDPNETQNLSIRVDGYGLPRGRHEYAVRIRDPQATNSPRQVAVTLNVNSTRRVPQEYGTIQEALDSAVDGDVVLVADGLYRGDGNRDLTMKGKAIRLRSANGPRNCIIDCQGRASDRHCGILFNSKEGPNSIVEGFSITHGCLEAISCLESSPVIADCVLFGNERAVYCSGGATTLVNCLAVGNAREGALSTVVIVDGSLGIYNCTIASNTSGHYTAGILNAGALTLANSIVWGNRDRTGSGRAAQVRDYPDATSHLYYNCIQGWSAADPNGVGNFSSDPRFVDPLDGDFHLNGDSPCIGAGDPNGAYLEIVADFEGDWRRPGKRVDLGADHFTSYDFDSDGKVDLADFGAFAETWQRESCADPDWCEGMDFDLDGVVAWTDLLTFMNGWPEKTARSNYLVRGFWPFDQDSGMVAYDGSMFLQSGTLVNMDEDAWVAGKLGGGLAFDGVDDYVQIGGWKGIGGGRSRTVCAWVKTADTAGVIVSWGPTGVAGARWLLLTEGGGRLRLEVGGGAVVGSAAICDGQWHHVAAVLDNDGTPNVGDVRLYVDGDLDTLSSSGDRLVNTVVDAAGSPDVAIGTWLPGGAYLAGVIDEVRIYERALSAEEVATLAGGN